MPIVCPRSAWGSSSVSVASMTPATTGGTRPGSCTPRSASTPAATSNAHIQGPPAALRELAAALVEAADQAEEARGRAARASRGRGVVNAWGPYRPPTWRQPVGWGALHETPPVVTAPVVRERPADWLFNGLLRPAWAYRLELALIGLVAAPTCGWATGSAGRVRSG